MLYRESPKCFVLYSVWKTFLALLFMVNMVSAQDTVSHEKLVGDGKCFIRFTNLRDDDAKILVRVHVVPNNDKPFGWRGWTTYIGSEEGENLPADKWLAPGSQSPWLDIGRGMSRRGALSPETYLSPVLCGVFTTDQKPGLHLLAEVAAGKGQNIIRRIEIHKPELKQSDTRSYPWVLGYMVWNHAGPILPTLGLLIPTRLDLATRVFTLEEELKWKLDFIEDFPEIGRKPTRFVFKAQEEPQIYNALGYNGYPEDTVEGSLGDEISISIKMPVEQQNLRFREYLKSKVFDPLEFIPDEKLEEAKKLSPKEQWELVTITPSLPEKPKQYYESANYRYRIWYEELAFRTEEIEKKHPGKRVLVGSNYSPHMNVWPDVRQWIGPFRNGAMTMTWTEDWWWQLPEVSPQVYGFLLDAFRLAHSYHGAPIQYYVMPYPGNFPDHFQRMNSLALAHGVKILNHFQIKSETLSTWDYVSMPESPRTYQAIYDVIRDVGAVEHRLYPAMPQPAHIAIMLSRASDTWDTENIGGSGHLYYSKYNVNNDERKAIWMSLRHAQYPVDLITDEDVADGLLEPYKVLYIVGSEMLRAAAQPLKKWIENGGIVYATGGGGLLDEYRKPLDTLYDMYGIKGHDLVRHTRHIRPRHTMKKVDSLDILVVNSLVEGNTELKIPAYLYRETLQAAGNAEIVANFSNDRNAGLVINHYGKGRTIYCGVLAGMAYLKPAMTDSSQILPTDFPADIREFLATPVRWAKIVPPVQSSDPLVETQYFSGAEGDIVVLINWHNKPIENITIRFPNRKNPIQSIRSLRKAGYFKGHLHEQKQGSLELIDQERIPAIKLNLDISDYLLVD